MFEFRISVAPDDNGTMLITCPDLPEVTTYAEDAAALIVNAGHAIEEALASRIADGRDIPAPSPAEGATAIRLPLLTTLKVALYVAARQQGVTRADLVRRLDTHREQVDRLFRLDHASRLDQIEAAFRALGQEVDVTILHAA